MCRVVHKAVINSLLKFRADFKQFEMQLGAESKHLGGEIETETENEE